MSKRCRAIGQAESGAKLLEQEIRRRTGSPPVGTHRLQPTGDFGTSELPVPVEELVRIALARRADLQALRMLRQRADLENLEWIQAVARILHPALGGVPGNAPRFPVPRMVFLRRQLANFAAAIQREAGGDLEELRGQLTWIIWERERSAADEVRGAVLVLEEQRRQAGLARWRVEMLEKRLHDARKDKRGPFVELPLQLELKRAEAKSS